MVILANIRRKYMVGRIPKGATVPMSSCVVTLDADSVTYTGSARTVGVTVTWEGATLVVNTDYTLSYSSNVNVGAATVTVTGMGQFSGSVTKTFYIVSAAHQGWDGIDFSEMSYTPADATKLYKGGSYVMASQQMNIAYDYGGHLLLKYDNAYIDWKFGSEDYELDTVESSEFKSKSGFVSAAWTCVIADSGTRMYFTSGSSDIIMWATLSTAYDISTATWQGSVSGFTPSVRPSFMLFSPDGKKFFYKARDGATVYCANLGTAFRFGSFVSEDSFDLNSAFGYSAAYGMCMSQDGKGCVFGIMEDSTPKLVRLSLSTPFDFSSASVASVSSALVNYTSYPYGVLVPQDGSRVLVWLSADNKIYEYSLA